MAKMSYSFIAGAVEELGKVIGIRDVFIGFQKYLYESGGMA